MSTFLYFCPTMPSNRNLLTQWAHCTNQAVYNGRGDYAGHGDQGILNSLMYIRDRGDGPELLDNETWSQHWKYWQSIAVYEQGRFLNYSREKHPQRSFHCGGAEKFWDPSHRDRRLAAAFTQGLHPQREESLPVSVDQPDFWTVRASE
jgi:hypothetical protein